MRPNRSAYKRWLAWLSLGVVVILLAVVFAACRFPQQILTMDSGPAKADALVVLGGGMTVRSQRATELFKAGEAPLIICTGTGDAGDNEACLTNAGLPPSAILLESKSRTTQENAEFTIAMLHALHLKSAIIVTSWFHSRCALACSGKCSHSIHFSSGPTMRKGHAFWLRKEDGWRVGVEFIKLGRFGLMCGI